MLVLGSYTDVYVSMDTGKTWDYSSTELADSIWVRHLVSVGDTIIAAATIRHGYPDTAAVLVSEDKGRTWEKRPSLSGCRSLTAIDSGIVAGRDDGIGKIQLLVTYDLCRTWDEWVESIDLSETAIRESTAHLRQIVPRFLHSRARIGLSRRHDHAGDEIVLYDIRGRMIHCRQGKPMGIHISRVRRPVHGIR
jgi:hypothetical protein